MFGRWHNFHNLPSVWHQKKISKRKENNHTGPFSLLNLIGKWFKSCFTATCFFILSTVVRKGCQEKDFSLRRTAQLQVCKVASKQAAFAQTRPQWRFFCHNAPHLAKTKQHISTSYQLWSTVVEWWWCGLVLQPDNLRTTNSSEYQGIPEWVRTYV